MFRESARLSKNSTTVNTMRNNLPVALLGVIVGSVIGYLTSQVVKTKEDDLIWNINDRYEKVLLLVSIVVVLLLVLVVVVYAR